MKKYILGFCAVIAFAGVTKAQSKKDVKQQTEKVSKPQAKILANGSAKVDLS